MFACLQGMCQVLPHFVQYNTAECVYKYIFEMSDLIDSFVYGDGLIWPGRLVLGSFFFRFLSAVHFLLRMDFVMLVLVLFCFVLVVLKGKGQGSGFGGYCDCPLVMIINKKNYKIRGCVDIWHSHPAFITCFFISSGVWSPTARTCWVCVRVCVTPVSDRIT